MLKVFHVDKQIANKNVEDSVTEWTRVVKYDEINAQNKLFGGQLMAWIDEVAGTVALRHSGNPVSTAAVDNMQFKQGAELGDVLVIIGKIIQCICRGILFVTNIYILVNHINNRMVQACYFIIIIIAFLQIRVTEKN